MAYSKPIVIVEDDQDDQDLIDDVFGALRIQYERRFFRDGVEALQYLKTTSEQPFLIICDINMPIMDGIELRAAIQADERLRKKSIPFIFLSTDASPAAVRKAYDLTVQGFFQKANTFSEMQTMLEYIVEYWKMCKHVNNISLV